MSKNKLPAEVVDYWPEVFENIEIKAVPVKYISKVEVVFKDGKAEALMPYSESFEDFKNIDLDTKMYYNTRSVNHLLDFCKNNNIELQIFNYNSIGFLKEHKKLIVDKGADGVHYGEETHKNFAGLFNVKRKDTI